jgi:hypothetical protein
VPPGVGNSQAATATGRPTRGRWRATLNPLWVNAAWAEGVVESDTYAIKRSMNRHGRLRPTTRCHASVTPAARREGNSPTSGTHNQIEKSLAVGNLAVDLPVEMAAKTQVPDNQWKFLAEREGFEERLLNQELTDSENDSVPSDPQKPP